MDEDRIKHSLGVAKKMMEIGKQLGLSQADCRQLFILGLNHDIGYEFSRDGKNHGEIGGEILMRSGFNHWKEVYYHGRLTQEYSSRYLDILNYADMQIDKYGNDVGIEGRLEDIKSRYGEESEVYLNCQTMSNLLKKKFSKTERDEER